MIFTVTKRDGSALDATLFTYDGSAQTLTTYTTDINKIATNPFELTAHVAYAGSYAIAGTLDFEVTLTLNCNSATLETLVLSDMSMTILGASDT